MPFEDFYKAADEARRRWRKCLGLAFVLLIVYWVFGFFVIPEVQPVYVEPPMSSDGVRIKTPDERQMLKQVRQLCASLPLPEKFYFVENDIRVLSPDLTLVAYRYRSNRTWDEVMPSFTVWLSANGWQPRRSDNSIFTKDNQTIAFGTVGGDARVNFEIDCSENGKASFDVNE